VGNMAERLEAAMLWLSLLSFVAGFALTATTAYYGSVFTALMAIFSFSMGILLYDAYRAPVLFEDMDSPDEGRKREARREFIFLFMLYFITWISYIVLADLFFNMFSNTEETIVVALPSSLGLVGLVALLFDILKRPPESSSQPEENQDLSS